jgi:hypothetical protein
VKLNNFECCSNAIAFYLHLVRKTHCNVPSFIYFTINFKCLDSAHVYFGQGPPFSVDIFGCHLLVIIVYYYLRPRKDVSTLSRYTCIYTCFSVEIHANLDKVETSFSGRRECYFSSRLAWLLTEHMGLLTWLIGYYVSMLTVSVEPTVGFAS